MRCQCQSRATAGSEQLTRSAVGHRMQYIWHSAFRPISSWKRWHDEHHGGWGRVPWRNARRRWSDSRICILAKFWALLRLGVGQSWRMWTGNSNHHKIVAEIWWARTEYTGIPWYSIAQFMAFLYHSKDWWLNKSIYCHERNFSLHTNLCSIVSQCENEVLSFLFLKRNAQILSSEPSPLTLVKYKKSICCLKKHFSRNFWTESVTHEEVRWHFACT